MRVLADGDESEPVAASHKPVCVGMKCQGLAMPDVAGSNHAEARDFSHKCFAFGGMGDPLAVRGEGRRQGEIGFRNVGDEIPLAGVDVPGTHTAPAGDGEARSEASLTTALTSQGMSSVSGRGVSQGRA